MLELCCYYTTLPASSSTLRCPMLPEIKPRNSFLKMFLKCFFIGSEYSQNPMRGNTMERINAQKSGKLGYGQTIANYS